MIDRKNTIFVANSVIFWTILASIRTIRNTRTIRVFGEKIFYIRVSTIPTRTGNPKRDATYQYIQSRFSFEINLQTRCLQFQILFSLSSCVYLKRFKQKSTYHG